VSYLNKQTDFDVEGLTGGINFTKPNPLLGGAIPRVFNDRIWLAHAVNGTAVPLNGNKPFSLYLKQAGSRARRPRPPGPAASWARGGVR
jgi:hypothetical protein